MSAIGLKSAIGAKHGFRPRSCPAMARLVSEIGAWAGLIDSASKRADHCFLANSAFSMSSARTR